MTAHEVDLAIVRWTLVARDYRCCKRNSITNPLTQCKPQPASSLSFQFDLAAETNRNVCTADEA